MKNLWTIKTKMVLPCVSVCGTLCLKTHGRYALAYFCDGHICLEGNNAMFTYSSDIFLTQYTCYTAKTKLNDIESLVEVVRHDHTTAYARYHHSNPMLWNSIHAETCRANTHTNNNHTATWTCTCYPIFLVVWVVYYSRNKCDTAHIHYTYYIRNRLIFTCIYVCMQHIYPFGV